jgi:hypothetical protein
MRGPLGLFHGLPPVPTVGRQAYGFAQELKLKSEVPAEILFGFETEPNGVVENHRLRVKSTRILTPKKH